MSVAEYVRGSAVSVTNPTFTTNAALPGGALGIIGVWTGGGLTPSALSDGTNSYTNVFSFTDTTINATISVWTKENAAAVGSGATLTVTVGSTSIQSVDGLYVTDGNTSSSLDVTASANPRTTTFSTGTTASTGQALEVAVAFFMSYFNGAGSGSSLGSLTAGYTGLTEVDSNISGSAQFAAVTAYQLLAATGTQSASMTATGGGGGSFVDSAAAIVTFKRTIATPLAPGIIISQAVRRAASY